MPTIEDMKAEAIAFATEMVDSKNRLEILNEKYPENHWFHNIMKYIKPNIWATPEDISKSMKNTLSMLTNRVSNADDTIDGKEYVDLMHTIESLDPRQFQLDKLTEQIKKLTDEVEMIKTQRAIDFDL